VVEADDRRLLPLLEPVVAGNLAVVLVGPAVALAPLVELARSDPEPQNEEAECDPGLLAPLQDEVDEGVAGIVRDPSAV
jgi:hypothetical protein